MIEQRFRVSVKVGDVSKDLLVLAPEKINPQKVAQVIHVYSRLEGVSQIFLDQQEDYPIKIIVANTKLGPVIAGFEP